MAEDVCQPRLLGCLCEMLTPIRAEEHPEPDGGVARPVRPAVGALSVLRQRQQLRQLRVTELRERRLSRGALRRLTG